MINPIIADAGVIVALIDKSDQWHEWATQAAAALPAPYLTCDAVIAEACHLLRREHGGTEKVFMLLKSGALLLAFDLSTEIAAVDALMKKYKDVPMDFADACLVRMSELHNDAQVFTVDGDFRIYRKHGKKEISLVIPDSIRF